MAYASKAGRAHADPRNPQAFGVCMRCGIWYQRNELRDQFDWRGAALQNLYILVCRYCLDRPQEQLRAIVVPADPTPIIRPSPEFFISDEQSARYTQGNTTDFITGIPIPGGDERTTEDDATRVVQQTGEPPGGLNQQPGTDPNVPGPTNLPPENTEVPETGPLS